MFLKKKIGGKLACASVFVLLLAAGSSPLFAEEQADEAMPVVNELIKKRVEGSQSIAGEPLRTRPLLKIFYEHRNYEPVWGKKDRVYPQAKRLLKAVQDVELEGLDPANYHLSAIVNLLEEEAGKNEKNKDALMADIDVLLTDTFFSMAFHFSHGMINPYRMDIQWYSLSDVEGYSSTIVEAVKSNRVEEILYGFLPSSKGYKDLKKVLAEYKEMQKDTQWPKIAKLEAKQKINLGDEDERILFIRERLGVTKKNAYNEDNPLAKIYDESLQQEIIEFQRQNGLLDDGVIGWRTVDALNVSIPERIEQIKVNMDRHRAWAYIMKDQKDRVVVNIPGFYLTAYENDQPMLDMRVIVGMYKRKTPLLSSRIMYLIFSPKWFVPDTILFEDKLPKIKKDPAFLKRQGMKVYEKGGEQVDPETIDWSAITSKDSIPYRVVQASGNLNALGKVKFIFPNRHDVYLHDTPGKELFNNASRTFSSGCIRIAKPVELASLLLNDKPEWDAASIEAAMNRGYEKKELLTEPVPVHITYVTGWVDEDGVLQFRNDVYGYDGVYERNMEVEN